VKKREGLERAEQSYPGKWEQKMGDDSLHNSSVEEKDKEN
jgi:hypothetical protein